MRIGIDASRAFVMKRTGIEAYSYHTIKHLRGVIPKEHRVVLYVRKTVSWRSCSRSSSHEHQVGGGWFGIRWYLPNIDFALPDHWEVRGLWAPRFWTQCRLSLEMLFHPVDALFVSAHVVPVIHPRHTIVTIHGLEYEFCPEAYSWFERWYMRLSIRLSSMWASRIVAVSDNTKRDLVMRYRIPAAKVDVVYEGYDDERSQGLSPDRKGGHPMTRLGALPERYLLFVGRIEVRKNVLRIIRAFEILKSQYHIPHVLLLAGKPGYGYEDISVAMKRSPVRADIRELGYVTEEEKWILLQNADVFLFPSLYEGFGIPVLEAQVVGVPVVTARAASLPEVGGEGALYADPSDAADIACQVWALLSDPLCRDAIIRKGTMNLERFSFQRGAKSIATLLLETSEDV